MAEAKLVVKDIEGTKEDVEIYTENAASPNPTMAQIIIMNLVHKIHETIVEEKGGVKRI